MDLRTFEYRDPARLIHEVGQQLPLRENTVHLVLVANPSTEQRIVGIVELETPAVIEDYFEASCELREAMGRLPIPDHGRPPDHSVMTLVVRPGLCVFGPNESRWLRAWRYSNHLTNAFSGELILVTEHGWCDFTTYEAGHSPAMAA